MKKAILLLTMVCVGQLYGMEDGASKEAQVQAFKTLMQKLKESKNLVQFTRLMNRFCKMYPDVIREKVAQKVGTPIAQKYIELNKSLVQALLIERPDLRLSTVKTLVNRGADVNFTFKYDETPGSVLGTAYKVILANEGTEKELVQYLLDNGANPNVKYGNTTLLNHSLAPYESK